MRKMDTYIVASTNNSKDSSGIVIKWRKDLANLTFATLAATNYTGNSNFVISKKISLDITTSTIDKFVAIFSIITNITLKRKRKIYKSNLFFFIPN